jgi:hypothetical protein
MRLQTIDFNPRTTRLSTRWRVGSLAGVAAGMGAGLSIALIGGQPAFAGWTSVPTTASAPTSTAAGHCEKHFGSDIAIPGTTGDGWSPVVTDVRGPFTFIVYQQGTATATCFDGPTWTVVDAASGNAIGAGSAGGKPQIEQHSQSASVSKAGAPGAGYTAPPSVETIEPPILLGADIENVTVSRPSLAAAGNADYTVVDGQIAPDVSALTLQLSDGSVVQATAGAGWFVAWWPGSANAASAQVTTPAGQHVEQFDQWLPVPVPGVGLSCSGSPITGGTAGAPTVLGQATASACSKSARAPG